jgi:hypothetical protein
MPKLPSNLVKPPAFDNPLRRTTPIDVSPPEASPMNHDAEQAPALGGVVIPIVTNARTDGDHDHAPLVPMQHRITVRIDDSTRRALEAECYKRRVAGKKANIAEIARGILSNWTNRAE